MKYKRTLIGVAIALAVLGAAYLLRWPLLEGTIRNEIRKQVAQHLNAEITIGKLSGSLVRGMVAEDVSIRAPTWQASIRRVDATYKPVGASKVDIQIDGVRAELIESGDHAPPSAPPSPPSPETLAHVRDFRFPGRLRVRDAVVLLAAGKEVTVEAAEMKGGQASVALHMAMDEPPVTARAKAAMLDSRVSVEMEWTLRGQPQAPLKVEIAFAEEATIEASWGELLKVHGVVGKETDLRIDATLGSLRELLPVRVSGDASLHLRAIGSPIAVSGTLETRELSIAGTPPLTMIVPLFIRDGAVILPRTVHYTPFGEIALEARIPLSADEPMEAIVRSESTYIRGALSEDVRTWAPPLLDVDFHATGTPADPELALNVESVGEPFRPSSIFGPIGDLKLEATMKGGELRVVRMDAEMGGGPFHMEGAWSLNRGTLDASLKGTDLAIVDMEDVRLRIDPDIRLTGTLPNDLRLEGKVQVPLALVHAELVTSAGGEESGRSKGKLKAPGVRLPLAKEGGVQIEGAAELSGITLNLDVSTTGEVRFENSIVGAMLTASLHVRGTGAAPVLDGNVTVRQGEVRLTSGVFIRIVGGRVDIPSEPGRDPVVHFEGRSGQGEEAIGIVISGPLPQPSLTLQSDPPRSQEELLAMLAFGRAPGALGEKEALGAVALQLVKRATDEWPSADPREGLLSRFTLTAGSGEKQETKPWELPPSGTAGGTAVKTEYRVNRYFSVVIQSNFENNLSGDLKLRIQFP